MSLFRLVRFSLLAALCVTLLACSSSTLSSLEGDWVIDIDKTVERNPSLSGNTTTNALTKGVAVAFLDGMSLSFDTKKKTVSGKLIGVSFSGEDFGVVEDNSDSCTLLVVRQKLTCKPDGDSLVVTLEGKETILVFARQKKG